MIGTEKLEKDIEGIKAYLGKFGKFMNKQWKLCYIMFFIITGMFYLSTLIFLIAPSSEEFTVNNTKEYTATISKIQLLPQYSIQVEEYNAALGINFSEVIIDFEALGDLYAGQTITFRITNDSSLNLGMITERLELVALKAGTTDIITLESYNKYINDQYGYSYAGAITFGVMGTIMLGTGIWFRKTYKNKSQELEKLLGNQGMGLNY